MESFKDLVTRTRSYRRFKEDVPLDLATLTDFVECARLTPSAANLQPLKYIISVDPAVNAQIFPTLAWAGYLTEWPGPAEGERPTGYIVILADHKISKVHSCDHGIAAQTIMLAAAERGIGSCIIGSVQREALAAALSIEPGYEILLVLALGMPNEKVVLEVAGENGIRYYRDDQGVHHVPKRPLEEVLIK